MQADAERLGLEHPARDGETERAHPGSGADSIWRQKGERQLDGRLVTRRHQQQGHPAHRHRQLGRAAHPQGRALLQGLSSCTLLLFFNIYIALRQTPDSYNPCCVRKTFKYSFDGI